MSKKVCHPMTSNLSRIVAALRRSGRRDWFALVGVSVAIAAFALSTACMPGEQKVVDTRPLGTLDDIFALQERDDLNVLFILVDTLRADRLSCYGHDRKTSPRIDALAESGVRFSRHLAQSSWTKCSMASMWTGLYPNRARILLSRHALPEAAVLPAEIFRDAGYRTTGIFRNGWVARNFGFSQGFEIYMMPRPPREIVRQSSEDPAKLAASDGDVIRAATGFLRAHEMEQWFMYVHLLDIHQYTSDEASAIFGTSYSDIYDNAILTTDSLIGHLLDELDGRGLRERTIVVLASDHGEAFGEHDKDGHAYDVYGEVTEVPFVISLPFRLESGVVVDSPSENVDIWPTLFDLIGLSGLEDPDGASLLPAIESAMLGEPSPDEGSLSFSHLEEKWGRLEEEGSFPMVSVTEDDWRLIYKSSEESPQLFNKKSDPGEKKNIAKKHEDVVAALQGEVDAYLEQDEAPWPEENLSVELDDMELNQLRALGYGIQ